MKRIFIIAIGILFVHSSCTKLDEEVYDNIPGDKYPENAAQIANLAVNAYAPLKEYADDEGWWFLAQIMSGDLVCGPTRGADWFDGGKWVNMHRHEWTDEDEGVSRMYDHFWRGITISNMTLDMMKDMDPNETIMIKIKELEVLRSFYYYLLIDNYGDVPYLSRFVGAPEKPFKEPREAIFDSLVNTITNALPYLKAADNKYMITKYAGYALLAKLYLNAEVYKGEAEWAKAEMYIDSVLSGPYNLSANVLEPFTTNNENSPEIIFSIPYDEDNFKGFRLHMRTLHYQHNLKFDMSVGPWNGFAIVPTHFDRYEDGDTRKEGYNIYGPQYDSQGNVILDGTTHQPLDINPYLPALTMSAATHTAEEIRTTGARIGKYEVAKGAKENLSNDLPIFRLSDFWLMKAEVLIRQGGNGDDYINDIRDRANVDPMAGATLEMLLDERGRELYCEGHRRQDLIRFGKYGEVWWEKSVSTPDRETFPIPKWATDVNPNLLQ
ncbi:MAG: RagB/SusD family nutrient uptake outer membrane protein [Bacteroidota bacterium]